MRRILAGWRDLLVEEDFRRGCPFAATTVDTSAANPALRAVVSEYAGAWHDDLAAVLEDGGLAAARAASLATLVQASVQGALILARGHRSTAPLDEVETELTSLLEALLPGRAAGWAG